MHNLQRFSVRKVPHNLVKSPLVKLCKGRRKYAPYMVGLQLCSKECPTTTRSVPECLPFKCESGTGVGDAGVSPSMVSIGARTGASVVVSVRYQDDLYCIDQTFLGTKSNAHELTRASSLLQPSLCATVMRLKVGLLRRACELEGGYFSSQIQWRKFVDMNQKKAIGENPPQTTTGLRLCALRRGRKSVPRQCDRPPCAYRLNPRRVLA